jgi:dipeptidyl-peptidase-4
MKNGIYDKVLLFNGQRVKHYATTDHKEYFAEATETYFYRNDFYPFVRAELELHDPLACAEMKRVWEPAE